MRANSDFIAMQQFQNAKEIMGPELYLAFDIMTTKLGTLPRDADVAPNSDSARTHAELREARTIAYNLKHPNAEHAVRRDDMAWALSHLMSACNRMGMAPVSVTLGSAALVLGIDVAQQHGIPHELDKKIGNVMKVLHPAEAPALMAAAG